MSAQVQEQARIFCARFRIPANDDKMKELGDYLSACHQIASEGFSFTAAEAETLDQSPFRKFNVGAKDWNKAFDIRFEDSGDEAENARRFWVECYRIALNCFRAFPYKVTIELDNPKISFGDRR